MKKISFVLIFIFIVFNLYSAGNTEQTNQANIRVVSLGANVTEIICALGGYDNLVGRTDFCNYPEKVQSIQSVGTITQPNIETIITLRPTDVIASSIAYNAYVDKIGKAGIKTHRFYEEYNGMEGTFNLITEIGKIIGKTNEAEKLVNSQRHEIQNIQEKLSLIENKKTCAVLICYGQMGDYAATGDSFINSIIELGGGINVAKNNKLWNISKEFLLQADPDVIFISNEFTVSDFISKEPYSKLTSSKTNNVYAIDSDILQRQGPRSIDCIKQISQTLYPQLYK